RRLIDHRLGWPFDRDRIGPNHRLLAAKRYSRIFSIDAALNEPVDRFDEIVAMKLRVEAKDGAAKKSFDDLLFPGTNSECFGIRPGDMPERDDGRLGETLADHSWRKSEMVVLDKNDWIFGFSFLNNGARKSFVDFFINAPIALTKNGAHKG